MTRTVRFTPAAQDDLGRLFAVLAEHDVVAAREIDGEDLVTVLAVRHAREDDYH